MIDLKTMSNFLIQIFNDEMNILVEYRENFFWMEDFFITEMYSIFRLNSSETIASTAVDIPFMLAGLSLTKTKKSINRSVKQKIFDAYFLIHRSTHHNRPKCNSFLREPRTGLV